MRTLWLRPGPGWGTRADGYLPTLPALALLFVSLLVHTPAHELGIGSGPSEKFEAAAHAEEPAHLEAAGHPTLSERLPCLSSHTTHDLGTASIAGPSLLPTHSLRPTRPHRAGGIERVARASRAPPLS